MIIKTKFKCKSSSQISGIGNTKWIDRFIEGKWYDGEYETWSWEDGYRINGGWRRYWVVDESGKKSELSRGMMNIVFHIKIDEIRDQKIKDILDEKDTIH